VPWQLLATVAPPRSASRRTTASGPEEVAIMVDVQVSVAATIAPDRVRSALTDFSGRRLQLFPNLDRRFYQVHQDPAGGTWAEVTEGSALAGGIWERGRYDWSAPGQVRFDVRSLELLAAELPA
jgi:hypothetical protein